MDTNLAFGRRALFLAHDRLADGRYGQASKLQVLNPKRDADDAHTAQQGCQKMADGKPGTDANELNRPGFRGGPLG